MFNYRHFIAKETPLNTLENGNIFNPYLKPKRNFNLFKHKVTYNVFMIAMKAIQEFLHRGL